jgi:RNA polymerase sigma-70 factor, ECF subfamily
MFAAAPSPEFMPDAQLAQRIAGGDIKAFEHLMRQHNRMLFRTARAILHDDADAEEVLQEAYLRAFHSMQGFRAEARLSTWLARIVVNEALARRRKDVRRAAVVPIHSGPADPEHGAAMAIPDGDGPDDSAERGELRRLLERKIDALPESFRAVFMLRELEEMSVQDTAAVLGIPEATVRTRLFRARSQLREALSQEIDVACGDAFCFLGDRCNRVVAGVTARLAVGKPGLS